MELSTYYDEAVRGNGNGKRRRVHISTKRDWAWLCAVEKTTGTPIVDGPYDTEDEANRIGLEKIQGDFEVMMWPTVDKNRATAMWRHERLNRGEQIVDIVRKRTKHKI